MSTPNPIRWAVASAWCLTLAPFVLAAAWTALARPTGAWAHADAPTLVIAGTVVGALTLVVGSRHLHLGLAVAAIGGAAVGAATAAGPGVALGGLVVALAAALALLGTRTLAAALPELAPSRSLQVAWALALVVSLGSGPIRLGAFMADPGFTAGAILPDDPFVSRHACLTAYVHGSILADAGDNAYDLSYAAPDPLTAPLPATAAHFAPFVLDVYGYGPPFLVLPGLLRAISGDFVVERALFALGTMLLTVLCLGAFAAQLGGAVGRRMAAWGPVAIGVPAVMAPVSVSNYHLALVATCALAWVAFERQRDALGGGLLAFAILAKISPGLLGVVLLARRQWRAALSTAAAAAVLSVATLPWAGTQTWVYFVTYLLPRLSTGEALGFLDDTLVNIQFNMAPFGIPFKLAELGFAGWGWDQAHTFNDVYTVAIFVIATASALRGGPPAHRAVAWMSVLSFAALRSPYAPLYTQCSVSVVLLLLIGEVRGRSSAAVYVAAWVLMTMPLPGLGHAVGTLISLAAQLYVLVFLAWACLRRPAA